MGKRRGLHPAVCLCRRISASLLLFLLKAKDACVRLVGHFGEQQQVVAAEAWGGLPIALAVAVDAGEGDVETIAVIGLVAPDDGFDAAAASTGG